MFFFDAVPSKHSNKRHAVKASDGFQFTYMYYDKNISAQKSYKLLIGSNEEINLHFATHVLYSKLIFVFFSLPQVKIIHRKRTRFGSSRFEIY